MGNLLSIVTSLPENGTLVVMGIALIAAALILRRVVAALREVSRSKSGQSDKVGSLPGSPLTSERPDQVVSA